MSVGHFQSRFAIGDKVLWFGLTATVLEITFIPENVRYRVKFDAGGAQSVVDSQEVTACP